MPRSIFGATCLASLRVCFVGLALSAVIVVLLSGAEIRAHEIGTTRVSVFFEEDRTYSIDIVTDVGALVEKLHTSDGRASLVDTDPVRLESLLTSFDEQFRQRVKVAFDASAVRPAISYAVTSRIDATSPAVTTITLIGQIPPGAHHFTWTYGWTFASYALTVQRAVSENVTTEWLEGGQTSAPIALTSPAPPSNQPDTAWRYLTFGFTHIVPLGLDHILFVLGLYLLSSRGRTVLWQVSAFTVAHSMTLGLSMYDVVAVSPRIVEPMIALSIAYVALENIFFSELKPRRVALVFAFGLLHGMGFAGALKEVGLPRSEFVTALLTFNIEVEAGQLAVIGAAFLFVGWPCANRAWYHHRVVVPVSMLIACTAMYWTIERLSF